MAVVAGFDATLILWLNLVGTFVCGLSGVLAAVQARVGVLAAVVGLTGGGQCQADGGIRTLDPRFTRAVLWPTELRRRRTEV